MGLAKYRMGDLIEFTTEINDKNLYSIDDVKGVTITKEIIETKANVTNTDLSKFLVVHPNEFVYNPRTHGKKIGFGYNDTGKTFLISWNNIAFRIRKSMRQIILPQYLFLHFNREEWDREACYRSWGSSTEVFSWDALCEMELRLPSMEIQQRYVNVYNTMVKNQKVYEHGIEDFKLAIEGYIKDLKRKTSCEKIGIYLIESDKRNNIGLQKDSVRGLATSKDLISTKADLDGVSLINYKVMLPKQIAYVPDTSRRGDKVSLGFNNTNDSFLVSSISIVFSTKIEKLLPEYLMLFLTRSEFDRYARFNSWGSARETFGFDDMCDVKIPIPDINIQKAISEIYAAYIKRKEINELLKELIKNICPILIKGSLNEAKERLETE